MGFQFLVLDLRFGFALSLLYTHGVTLFIYYNPHTDLYYLNEDNIFEFKLYIKLIIYIKPTNSTNIMNAITTKRFVIRKSLIGTNTVITFTNNKNVECTYDHDKVYNQLKSKFDLMPCFAKYGSYTNTNNLPAFVRALTEIV